MDITDKMVLVAVSHMAWWAANNDGGADPVQAARNMLEQIAKASPEPYPDIDPAGNRRCRTCKKFACRCPKPGDIQYINA